jgi:hypothetical protein
MDDCHLSNIKKLEKKKKKKKNLICLKYPNFGKNIFICLPIEQHHKID